MQEVEVEVEVAVEGVNMVGDDVTEQGGLLANHIRVAGGAAISQPRLDNGELYKIALKKHKHLQ